MVPTGSADAAVALPGMIEELKVEEVEEIKEVDDLKPAAEAARQCLGRAVNVKRFFW